MCSGAENIACASDVGVSLKAGLVGSDFQSAGNNSCHALKTTLAAFRPTPALHLQASLGLAANSGYEAKEGSAAMKLAHFLGLLQWYAITAQRSGSAVSTLFLTEPTPNVTFSAQGEIGLSKDKPSI